MSESVRSQTTMLVESQKSPPVDSNIGNSRPSLLSRRSIKQIGLFAAGAGFFAASMLITKRSIMRKYHRVAPKFFHTSHPTNIKVDGAVEALEALSLATINVFSLAIMGTGGMLWAFDISSVNDMKRRFQMDMKVDSGVKDEYSDEVIEEWLKSILAKNAFKAIRESHSITDELLKLEAKGKLENRSEKDDKKAD